MSRNIPVDIGLVSASALIIAISAQLTFPLPATDIPQTAQTIAVLVIGYMLGPVRGLLAVLAYLFLGLAGLPVYSDGGSGWAVLTGSSFGYFVGFLCAATLLGYLGTQGTRHVLWRLCLLMFAGHLLILATGWFWMQFDMGALDAYRTGVAPFFYGGAAKAVMGASLVLALREIEGMRST